MLRIGVAQLRQRPFKYFWLVLGIFFAVTVTVATAAIIASLAHSTHQTVSREYAGADAVVSLAPTDRESAEAALAAVAETPGSADVAFDQVGTASVAVSGSLHSTITVAAITDGPQQWRSVHEGRLPAAPGEVAVVAHDIAVGSEQLLRPGQRGNPVPVTVVGRVSPSALEKFDREPVWLAHPQDMLDWFPDRVGGTIRVAASPGEDPIALARALEAALVPVTDVSASAVPAATQITAVVDAHLNNQLVWFIALGAFLLAIAGGAVFLLYTSWLRVLRHGEADLKLMREVGATAGQQRATLVVEATLVGAVAWLPGVPVGLLLAGTLADELGSDIPLAAISLDPVAHLLIAVGALGLSIATAVAAYRSTEQRFSGTVSGPRSSLLQKVLWLITGVVLLVIGGVAATQAAVVSPADGAVLAAVTIIGLVAGIALLSGLLIPALWRLPGAGWSGRMPAWVQLTAVGVRRYQRRISSLVAVVVAGTALSSLIFHAEQPVEELLTPQASSAASDAAEVVITGASETLSPQLISEVEALPGVAGVTLPPSVTVATPGERTDTAFAGAGPDELVLGSGSPLRTELVNGSVSTLNVLGQPHEVVVIFGEGPRTLIDAAVAGAAQAEVAAQRGVPVELAPELPAPVALVDLSEQARHGAADPTIEQIRALLTGAGQQTSLQVAPPVSPEVGPSGWLVAVAPALLILVLTFGSAGNLITLSAPGRSRWSRLSLELGLTAREQVLVTAGGLGPTTALAAIIGVTTGEVVAESALSLLPEQSSTTAAVPVWLLLAIVSATTVVAVVAGVVHRRDPHQRRGAAIMPAA